MPTSYSLSRKAEVIVLEKQDGSKDELELREMTASKRDAYLDRLRSRVQVNKQGQTAGIRSFDRLQADLIASCLFRGDAQVTMDEVQEWPSSVVADLFKKAQALNKLDVDAQQLENEAKNG